MSKRRRYGQVPPPDGGQTFQIMEPVTPVYLIPMPKPQRVVPLAGDPDWVISDLTQPLAQDESSEQDSTTPPAVANP